METVDFMFFHILVHDVHDAKNLARGRLAVDATQGRSHDTFGEMLPSRRAYDELVAVNDMLPVGFYHALARKIVEELNYLHIASGLEWGSALTCIIRGEVPWCQFLQKQISLIGQWTMRLTISDGI